MIGRIWHGAVPVEKSDAYLEKMRTVALSGYRGVDGNRGAWVMYRIEGDIAHFDMLSFWDDVDAIKRFAGEDYNLSYYFDFDDDFLIEKEPYVRHWDMYED
ncbi:MAG: antibiotic biosynthesis monooxygenase [Proteobacteria bacterium]|nr:antibiotic biosynthesis monooxygenase [Pseudomonadota bacterium]